MSDALGVAGEHLVTEDEVANLSASLTLAAPPVRLVTILKRTNTAIFSVIELKPTISGAQITVPLPRGWTRAGDAICWQSYAA
jgi:hypothetical protein